MDLGSQSLAAILQWWHILKYLTLTSDLWPCNPSYKCRWQFYAKSKWQLFKFFRSQITSYYVKNLNFWTNSKWKL